ncbi:hypothetical protein PHYSODRAFT_343407 [Phytophthora sojae]|uniref:RxLR effector protein n=1 Tax=Phytophthora sojae (strain P6497) TaxID=1094619 RepID=G5AJK1_PHYSP|nr:hypothetical protein PHYSODRAFT_331559 [Phytophthora sojae]XP_009540252.1 hypothetical protein PHYSODRAFT_343407 [Phytophthora sojae]EGZ04301.1 hypothetical protein PHYSODRAFT_343407 [Phytophthora sojae]EGZ17622.1 hypothetical protein PHYSODRAFT_331559 [Phytophthora sojae]|eukprot:XP_009526680.1 hypothetical protein PHYSODRAFT_331559 [Phytophthora sojae]
MSIVAIALALVCLVSFVFAANQPSIMTSPDERMQVAKQLKELMARNPGSVDTAVAAMSTEDLFGMLSGLISNPSVLSNVGNLVKAATSGDIGGVATSATGLLGAALPAAVSAFAPAGAAAAVPMAAAPAS